MKAATMTKHPHLDLLVRRLLDNPSLMLNEDVSDFGCRIVVWSKKYSVVVTFSFPKETISNKTKLIPIILTRLQQIYPATVKVSVDPNGKGDFKLEIPRKNQRCCQDLIGKLRVQILGAPILEAFKLLTSSKSGSDNNDDSTSTTTLSVPLGIHKISPSASINKLSYSHLIGNREKTMIIFRVASQDDVELAILRLFLQKFSHESKGTCICEYRRSNDSSLELAWLQDRFAGDDRCAGYLVFWFFPSHVHQLLRCNETSGKDGKDSKIETVVYQLVNFMVYLEAKVKEAKSFLGLRMREKKSFLLQPLVPKKGLVRNNAPSHSTPSRPRTPIMMRRKRASIAARHTPPRPLCPATKLENEL